MESTLGDSPTRHHYWLSELYWQSQLTSLPIRLFFHYILATLCSPLYCSFDMLRKSHTKNLAWILISSAYSCENMKKIFELFFYKKNLYSDMYFQSVIIPYPPTYTHSYIDRLSSTASSNFSSFQILRELRAQIEI